MGPRTRTSRLRLTCQGRQVVNPRGEAELLVDGASKEGQVVPLGDRPVTLGRESFNDVVIPEPAVSRVHALIAKRSGRFVLRDLNTTNGTMANRLRIGSEGYALHRGDVIRLANSRVEITFQQEDAIRTERPIRSPRTVSLEREDLAAQIAQNSDESARLELLNLTAVALVHHVRNAVSPIIGWAELVDKGMPGADVKLKELASKQGHQIVAIVDALIEMVEAGDDASVEMLGPGSRRMLDLKPSADRITEERKRQSDSGDSEGR